MLGVFKSKLLQSTSVFLLINFINKAFPFILLPLFTRNLTLEEYGTFSLYRAASNIFIPLIGVSLSESVIRSYYDRNKIDYPVYISTAIFLNTATLFLYLFFIFISYPYLSSIIELPRYMWFLVAFYGYFSSINNIDRGLLRCEYNNKSFAKLVLGQSLLYFLLILSLFYFKVFTLKNSVYVEFLVFFLFAIISIVHLNRRFGLALMFRKSYMKSMFSFSIPLFFNSLLAYGFALSDRFIIGSKLTLSDVAVYSATFQITSVTQILAVSFNAAWLPWVYNHLNEGKPLRQIFRNQFLIALLYFMFGLVFWLLAFNFMSPILGNEYQSGRNLLHWFLLSNFFQGLYWLFTPFVLFYKKNWYLVYGSFSALSLSICLNFIFLSRMGLEFAAFVNFASWLIFFIAVLMFSFKLLRK